MCSRAPAAAAASPWSMQAAACKWGRGAPARTSKPKARIESATALVTGRAQAAARLPEAESALKAAEEARRAAAEEAKREAAEEAKREAAEEAKRQAA